MGSGAVVQHDALRMLCQNGDQRFRLGRLARGQGRITHMHIVVCKAVGEPTRPGRALDAVFGHIHPAVHPVQIGPAAKHHCGRGQGAGAAPALFEVEPNINGKGWLKDSIESVYAQTEQDFELIIVDNGSTDESLEQARSYCGRPNFTLIENGTNTGFSHAVNQGIARAKGEYVVMFNNDAFAEPEWLAELIRTAETDSKIFAVQSLMLRHFERELADDAGDYVTWMGFACKTGDGRRASRYTKQKRIFSACGGAALYRKSILEEIGTFDENFFAYFEDVDLSWRANNAGYKCVLCPTARCYHICGASTGAVKYTAFKSQQSGRNSILLPLKNEPLLMLILNFLPLALGYLLKCYKFHKQGFGEAWDKGMHEAFALLKEGRLGKRPFRLKDMPNYILMELWMIWNMVPYL